MNAFTWIAAIIFFLELPTPIFWLVLHPQVRRWRGHLRAAYVTAVLAAWGSVIVFLAFGWRYIFATIVPGDFRIGFGLLFIAAGIWLFGRAKRDLGASRFVGKTELQGGGEVVNTGIYANIRNPRYVGMISTVLGSCLLAATPLMWKIAGLWLILVLVMIASEERELKARLGAPYVEYCRRVPRFIPHRFPRRSVARAK